MNNIDYLKNIFAAERQDNIDVLRRIENALTWDDLNADLRNTYSEDIPYRRLVIEHLGYLIDCCQRWHELKPEPPEIPHDEFEQDLSDGLDWPETIITVSIDDLPGDDQEYYAFIFRCSRRWRLDHRDSR